MCQQVASARRKNREGGKYGRFISEDWINGFFWCTFQGKGKRLSVQGHGRQLQRGAEGSSPIIPLDYTLPCPAKMARRTLYRQKNYYKGTTLAYRHKHHTYLCKLLTKPTQQGGRFGSLIPLLKMHFQFCFSQFVETVFIHVHRNIC